MDELAKTEARNYLSAAGFFLIAAYFILEIFLRIGSSTFVGLNDNIHIALGIGVLIVATLLIVLHKRDMIAILFFMMGFFQLFMAFTSSGMWNFILIGFMFLVALVTVTGQDKKKWQLFLIPSIWFIIHLIFQIIGFNIYLYIVFNSILAIISLYYAFCCACERCNLPGAKTLTADESTDFKASGSVLGYMLFAFIIGGWAIYNLTDDSAILPFESLITIELLCGTLLIFVAILLLTVGKMRFTPVMFLLMGLTAILGDYANTQMLIGIGILFVSIGLFCILRKESRILPGIMLILYSSVLFILGTIGNGVTAIAIGIIEIIVAAIAVYLSFVVYSQRKLPKF